MGIIRNTLKKEINTSGKTQFNDTTAVILDFDDITNTAEIKYKNPNGEGMLYRSKVHISETLGGIASAGVSIGDICSVTFINNNMFAPIITGVLANHFSDRTNNDQGGYLVDSVILKTTMPQETIPMVNSWFDFTNDYDSKYNNDICTYQDTDAQEETHYIISRLDKYLPDEQGITNLKTKSTIKFKDNGDIDIFISNNVGLRLSAEDETVNIYGDVFINGQYYSSCNCCNNSYSSNNQYQNNNYTNSNNIVFNPNDNSLNTDNWNNEDDNYNSDNQNNNSNNDGQSNGNNFNDNIGDNNVNGNLSDNDNDNSQDNDNFNADNNKDIISKIDEILRRIDYDATEIKKCINILILLNEHEEQYNDVREKIAEFEDLKFDFNFNQSKYSQNKLNQIYDKAVQLINYFDNELESGKLTLK